MATKYHDPCSCNRCGEIANELVVKAWDGARPCEYETSCTACDHKDYWAYGFFESSQDIVGKCATYSFD